jgi:hypothetical protein
MAKTVRKKRRKPAVRCGYVEEQYLAKGWICCACFKKQGVGVYNGSQRLICKMCGHERCKGAMRRKWKAPGIAPIALQGSDSVNLLGLFARAIGGMLAQSSSMQAKVTERPLFEAGAAILEDGKKANDLAMRDLQVPPEWQKACDEVISAFSAAEVHAEVMGHKEAVSSDVIAERIRSRLPRAMKMYDTVHVPEDTGPCRCRHMALIFVAAQDEATATGKPMVELLKSGQNVLDWYLKTVS